MHPLHAFACLRAVAQALEPSGTPFCSTWALFPNESCQSFELFRYHELKSCTPTVHKSVGDETPSTVAIGLMAFVSVDQTRARCRFNAAGSHEQYQAQP